MTFEFNDTMSIDIRGTYDPENPSAKLSYKWACPDYITSKSLCPAADAQ